MTIAFRFLRLYGAALLFTHVVMVVGIVVGHGLPRGDVLAFSVPIDRNGEWHIVTMDVRSRLMIRVADYGWRLALGLSWSPDGSRIAFATYSPRSDIYVVDVYRGELRNLTRDWAEDRYPTWSPDGRQIAFFSNRDYYPAARYDIYLMNVDDGGVQRVTYDEALYPSWSPDGAGLVYSAPREGNLYRLDFGCASVSESCLSRLTNTKYDDRNPVWSPDGQHIAFISFNPGGGSGDQVFVLDRESGLVRLLAAGWRFQGMPAWSPDGRALAFVGKAVTEQVDSLYVVDLDGTPRKLAENAYYAYNERWPMWSPDGRYLAYSHRHSGGLYRVEVATGKVEKLSDLPAIYPVWQP